MMVTETKSRPPHISLPCNTITRKKPWPHLAGKHHPPTHLATSGRATVSQKGALRGTTNMYKNRSASCLDSCFSNGRAIQMGIWQRRVVWTLSPGRAIQMGIYQSLLRAAVSGTASTDCNSISTVYSCTECSKSRMVLPMVATKALGAGLLQIINDVAKCLANAGLAAGAA